MKSELERTFETYWRQLGGPKLEPQYRFSKERRFAFDFANPETMIAIELEGGTWSMGRHVRGVGYASDCAKYNLAQLMGWRVFRFTSDMIRTDPAGHLGPVIEALTAGVTI